MNLRSFSVQRKKFFLLVGIFLTFVPACARKNRHVYDFRVPQRPPVQRVVLPYLEKLGASYNKTLGQYILHWVPLSLWQVPEGLRFLGYNIYQCTETGLFPRQPFLQVPPGVHSGDVSMAYSRMPHRRLFGIAPVFCDQNERELVGLITVKKLELIP